MSSFLLSCGGTGGHLFPALAVAEAFKERDRSNQVVFVGSRRGLESKVVAREGYELKTIDAEIRKLVEEMVTRDVNHPSILFWDNGNEGGWNTELDNEFARWDAVGSSMFSANPSEIGVLMDLVRSSAIC